MKNNYPSQEELTKVINLCINAVGNSCIGPIKKEFYFVSPTQPLLCSAEMKEMYIKAGRGHEIQTLVDGSAWQLVQILIGQLCPKSTQAHINLDDKGF